MISELHLSPYGSDDWNGLQPQPNENGTDGPLATFEGARVRIRRMRDQNMTIGRVTVNVQPGTYNFNNPLCFDARDTDITYVGLGKNVIVDGSVTVNGFSESVINGKVVWVADIPHILANRETPKSLFSNGERRPRSRFPKKGHLVIKDVPDHKGDPTLFKGAASRFIVAEGDFDAAWRNPDCIEAVVNHLWIEERMPVESYDPDRCRLTCTHRSIFSLKNRSWMGETPCAPYFLENVFEAMSEPGEWYIDPVEERLYYLPKAGEEINETIIQISPLTQLIRIHGDVDTNRKIEGIHFEGITFQSTDWTTSEGWGKWWDPLTEPHTWRKKDSFNHFNTNNLAKEGLPVTDRVAAVPQAAHDLPGVVSFESASNCSLTNCSFRNLGFYAVDVRGGCSHLRFQGNTFQNIGGGGIKVDGAEISSDYRLRTHRIYIGDNSMANLGEVFPSAVGVCICHADTNVVEHNEISNLFYTAISVGWTWGFDENPAHNNVIQYNYLHDIGKERLSDMGAIYTLGVQPGTIIRGNHIHDVRGAHYGGWGIYLDEGSSLISIEGNIVHHTKSQAFHEHWGRGNTVKDNIFALSESEAVVIAREERDNYIQSPQKGILFLRNVFLMHGRCAFNDSMAYFQTGLLDSDLNLFWDQASHSEPGYVNKSPWPMVSDLPGQISLEKARSMGLERHSLAQDPLFKNPQNGDFSFAQNSPLKTLGIRTLDTSLCGPRAPENRQLLCDASFRPSGDVIFSD